MQLQPDDAVLFTADWPIADYALIGDMRGMALVAKDGAIDWLCLARVDAVPVFAALLDAGQGGACTIHLAGGVLGTSRRYLPGTNIVETTLRGKTGFLVLTDFMPVAAVLESRRLGTRQQGARPGHPHSSVHLGHRRGHRPHCAKLRLDASRPVSHIERTPRLVCRGGAARGLLARSDDR